MHKIKEQQATESSREPNEDNYISRKSGDQDTGIRSQIELEGLNTQLEERNIHLEEKLAQTSEEHSQAQVVIEAQQGEIIRLRAELYEYYCTVIGNQHARIQELERRSGA